MKNIIFLILIFLFFVSCEKPTIFVLKDKDQNKFSLSDSVKKEFKKDVISRKPLIAINGIIWEYDKKSDTVVLPLTKKEIQSVNFLNKNNSDVIYGPKATDGAIIINAVNLK